MESKTLDIQIGFHMLINKVVEREVGLVTCELQLFELSVGVLEQCPNHSGSFKMHHECIIYPLRPSL